MSALLVLALAANTINILIDRPTNQQQFNGQQRDYGIGTIGNVSINLLGNDVLALRNIAVKSHLPTSQYFTLNDVVIGDSSTIEPTTALRRGR